MRKYTCEGCGTVAEFRTPEEAFKVGWDTPERFMSHCTCPNCLITTTLWWRLTIWREEHPDDPFPATQEELDLITSYNRLFMEYNEEFALKRGVTTPAEIFDARLQESMDEITKKE